MAKRMLLWCTLCDELVAGFGRDQTIGQMAQHLAARHPELTEAQRYALARRPWRPLPLAEALMAAPSPALALTGADDRRVGRHWTPLTGR